MIGEILEEQVGAGGDKRAHRFGVAVFGRRVKRRLKQRRSFTAIALRVADADDEGFS